MYKKLDITLLNGVTAFLHGNIDEEVLMTQPQVYVTNDEDDKVCQLNKAICGLKQDVTA